MITVDECDIFRDRRLVFLSLWMAVYLLVGSGAPTVAEPSPTPGLPGLDTLHVTSSPQSESVSPVIPSSGVPTIVNVTGNATGSTAITRVVTSRSSSNSVMPPTASAISPTVSVPSTQMMNSTSSAAPTTNASSAAATTTAEQSAAITLSSNPTTFISTMETSAVLQTAATAITLLSSEGLTTYATTPVIAPITTTPASITPSQADTSPVPQATNATNATTVPMTTQTRTPTPFDTSFATRPFWLNMGLGVAESIDIRAPSFVTEMERNLAEMYTEADRRSNQRTVEVAALLEQLDPENNPALQPKGRKKRAVTVAMITAQIIDMTRDTASPSNVELVFYVVEEGTKIPAGESRVVLDELTLQEMTLYLDVPVYSKPREFESTTTPMPTSGPPSRLWIIGAVLGPIALLVLLCLCCCCCCGRRPPKEDGPMDPDTFKMLQFKAKYPYRQYPSSPQDQQLQPVPRGFDVVKQDYANNAFGMEGGTTEGEQRNEEEAEVMIQREIPMRTVDGHISPLLRSSRHHHPSGHSPTPSGSSNSSLVPPLPVKVKGQQRAREVSTSGSEAGEDLYKQRKEFMAAQEEISRVLEPELYTSLSRKSQKAKVGGKKGGVQRMKDKKGAGGKGGKGKLKKMESLPDNHYARGGVGSQDDDPEVYSPPEPLQETRQKMHALIDEAFSLVGKTSPSRNAVVPIAADLSRSQNLSSREGKTTQLEQLQPEHGKPLFIPGNPPIPKRKPKDLLKDGGTQTADLGQTSRVVVIPINQPAQEGSRLVWSPYNAGDDMAAISPTKEPASLPGGLSVSPVAAPRGGTSGNQKPASSRESKPDGDSLRGNKQGVVERYADMLQEMLSTQQQRQPGEEEEVTSPRQPAQGRRVTLLEGEPDYDWSFDRSVNGSQGRGSTKSSKSRQLAPDRDRDRDGRPSPAPRDRGNAPSVKAKERGVGKTVDKFYDELDVSNNLKYPTGQFSPQVTNAVREELMRLTRRMGDGEESGTV